MTKRLNPGELSAQLWRVESPGIKEEWVIVCWQPYNSPVLYWPVNDRKYTKEEVNSVLQEIKNTTFSVDRAYKQAAD